jgi:phosphoribosylanthranilate isomerase
MKSHILRAATVIAPLLALGATTATPASAAPSSAAVWAASNVQLVNWQTGKCLTIAGGVSTENNVVALQYTCDTHPSRYWALGNQVGQHLQFRNVQTGKCLTIAGGVSTENNLEAVQYTCDSHPSRFWEIRDYYG